MKRHSFPICFAVVGKMILWERTVNVRLAKFMSNAHKTKSCKRRQKLLVSKLKLDFLAAVLVHLMGRWGFYWIWYHSSWAETALFVGDRRLKEGHNWIITPALSLFQLASLKIDSLKWSKINSQQLLQLFETLKHFQNFRLEVKLSGFDRGKSRKEEELQKKLL